MAKIKSTLDLVMERTRNLSMSEEERESLHMKEWRDSARGLVQKLIDNRVSLSELGSSLKSQPGRTTAFRDILRDELIGHIDPDSDNAPIFQALDEVLGLDVGEIRETIATYRARFDLLRNEHRERRRSELEGMEISGTAVMPNVEHDGAWKAAAKELREEFIARTSTLRGT